MPSSSGHHRGVQLLGQRPLVTGAAGGQHDGREVVGAARDDLRLDLLRQVGWIRFNAVCILLTAWSRSVPYSYSTWRVVEPSREVEVTFLTPAIPLMPSSIGAVTWSSTISGEAPG